MEHKELGIDWTVTSTGVKNEAGHTTLYSGKREENTIPSSEGFVSPEEILQQLAIDSRFALKLFDVWAQGKLTISFTFSTDLGERKPS